MAIFDIVVVLMLAIGALSGYKKGLVRQLLGLLGLFIGTYWAYNASEDVSKILMNYFGTQAFQSRIITFIILLIITYTLVLVLAFVINKMLRLAMLGWLNKLMGMFIGMLTVSILICVFVFVLNSLNSIGFGSFGDSIKQSVSYPILLQITEHVLPFLDSKYTESTNDLKVLFTN